eukprot:CAMPEP_0194278828 /NCGR_PEP_ID=MMETSP0169-20130528/12314_1 /TAXON_ID=218684 /ORGANISM="Corethron pennatum, Strain L29A3" /LENGTH=211 /DNA_ID=CAMNT_0039023109 /DNA_START=50 /DNA_END=685 /DNA_ORIENTATION=+
MSFTMRRLAAMLPSSGVPRSASSVLNFRSSAVFRISSETLSPGSFRPIAIAAFANPRLLPPLSPLAAASSSPVDMICRLISSNRSKRGLYDGRDIRSGNRVSFSNRKTRRKFRPNVFKKRLYSEIFGAFVGPLHVTAGTLRSIDAAGGIDSYVMNSKHVVPPPPGGNNRIQIRSEGWALRKKLLKKLRNDEAKRKRKTGAVGNVDTKVSSV